jgi:hypothetical protein
MSDLEVRPPKEFVLLMGAHKFDSRLSSMCGAPTGLVRFGFVYPALTHWTSLFRTSGAKKGDEIGRRSSLFEFNRSSSPCDDAGRFVSSGFVSLTPYSRDQKHQERGEAQGAADCVQCCPALQELFGEFGVFVQGGVEEALVGGEDDD